MTTVYIDHDKFLTDNIILNERMSKLFRVKVKKAMNENRQAKLKSFHNAHNFHKLLYSKAKIQDDYLNPKTLATREVIHSRIEKIINCSSVNMQSEDIDLSTGDLKTFSLYNSLCGVYVVCPVCSRIRSEIIWSKYGDKVKYMHEKYKNTYHIIFTLENRENFEEMYALINESISRFFKLGQRRGNSKRSGGESSKIKSAIASIEVKTGRNSKKAHVHLHMLAFTDIRINYEIYDQGKKALLRKVYPKRIPKKKLDAIAKNFEMYKGKKTAMSKLSQEWFTATSGNSINIECNKLKEGTDINKSLREVVKYPMKVNGMKEDLFLDVLLNKDNKRFLRIYGDMINRDGADDITVEQEEKEILSHSVDVKVYDRDRKRFVRGSDEQYDMAYKLNGKREELKKYFSKCSLSRCHERDLLQPIRSNLILFPKQTAESKKENIKQRNAVFVAWKHYLKTAYHKILKIQNVKCYRKGKSKLTRLEKYYYGSFLVNVPIA